MSKERHFLSPAHRTTALLSRCIEQLGPIRPVTRESVAALTVGDREALLLHLRRMTLGDRISCVLSCPEEHCGARMDLDIDVADLLLPAYAYEGSIHETVVEDEQASYLVRFRLPNGTDQEVAVGLASRDEKAAANIVLKRCVQQVRVRGNDKALDELPEAVIEALPRVMSELDPQAEIRMNLTCPTCGAHFTFHFDTADYFFREMSITSEHLYQQIHFLAFHYHWSESDIMAFSRQKRLLYVGLLSNALRGD